MNAIKARQWPGPAPINIANAMLFNLGWAAIVLTHSSFAAVAILAIYLVAHFRTMGKGKNELLLVAGVTLLGAIIDQVLFRLGVFNIAGQAALAPLWLTCLWPVFATTLMHAFESLQARPYLALVVGASGGALSYIAGVRLSPVEFGSPVWGPIIIGVLWAIVLPLLLKLAASMGRQEDALQSWEPAPRRAFD